MFTAISLLLSQVTCYASDGNSSATVEATIPAKGYDNSGSVFPSAMRFSFGNCTYDIPFLEHATRVCDKKIKTNFHIPVQAGANVWVHLEYLPYKDDLILVYDTQNDREDWSAGMVTRLDGKSLTPKWSIEISGFNTCPCLREGSMLYVTASRFIGKIDLDKGQYLWSVKLDEPYDLVEVPRLINNKLILKENIEGTKKAKARIIEINKETGEILKK